MISFPVATRAPTGGNIRVDPCVELLAIEGDAAVADRDLGQRWAHFEVEAVLVHAAVAGGVAQSNESIEDHDITVRVNESEW